MINLAFRTVFLPLILLVLTFSCVEKVKGLRIESAREFDIAVSGDLFRIVVLSDKGNEVDKPDKLSFKLNGQKIEALYVENGIFDILIPANTNGPKVKIEVFLGKESGEKEFKLSRIKSSQESGIRFIPLNSEKPEKGRFYRVRFEVNPFRFVSEEEVRFYIHDLLLQEKLVFPNTFDVLIPEFVAGSFVELIGVVGENVYQFTLNFPSNMLEFNLLTEVKEIYPRSKIKIQVVSSKEINSSKVTFYINEKEVQFSRSDSNTFQVSVPSNLEDSEFKIGLDYKGDLNEKRYLLSHLNDNANGPEKIKLENLSNGAEIEDSNRPLEGTVPDGITKVELIQGGVSLESKVDKNNRYKFDYLPLTYDKNEVVLKAFAKDKVLYERKVIIFLKDTRPSLGSGYITPEKGGEVIWKKWNFK